MNFFLYNKITSLPFVLIENKLVNQKLEKKPILKIIVDILDGDIWSSKVSFWGNSFLVLLICLSSLEVILSSDSSLSEYQDYFNSVYYFTSIFFLFEISCRISLANYIDPNYKGFKGTIKYLFSFYGLIDLLAIFPFCIAIFGFNSFLFLRILRILRIWRIVRYIPAFSSITNAFKSKRDEILVSLLGVVLLSITLSAFIFYAEIGKNSNDFRSIFDVFIWSLGKYTGDYGSIAEATPSTFIGKFLATLNGLLGLALFAVPAGLLGSAFIDELSEQKQNKIIKKRIIDINTFFDTGYKPKLPLNKRKSNFRYLTFDALQSRLLFTDDELLECIRESKNLRFRPMKSNDQVKYSDIKIIERFENNTTYGCKLKNNESSIYIINPLGAIERCISHFSYTIVDNLGYNYLSREIRLVDINNEIIGGGKTKFYSQNEQLNSSKVPSEFIDFMTDIKQIKKNDIVIVLSSCAASKGDFIIEYGNDKENIAIKEGVSTVNSLDIINTLTANLITNSNKIETVINEDKIKKYTIENHSIGNLDEEWLGKAIRNLTGANTITLYVNINILIGDDKIYYEGLNLVLNSFESTFGNHKNR